MFINIILIDIYRYICIYIDKYRYVWFMRSVYKQEPLIRVRGISGLAVISRRYEEIRGGLEEGWLSPAFDIVVLRG